MNKLASETRPASSIERMRRRQSLQGGVPLHTLSAGGRLWAKALVRGGELVTVLLKMGQFNQFISGRMNNYLLHP